MKPWISSVGAGCLQKLARLPLETRADNESFARISVSWRSSVYFFI